ncbi:MAG: S4 domain-containing protein YaaA [Erysipelotrichaceae bacterium]|nr:S4 domain-containing protein YaaA [Erysipelotrichaceae bacterium]
MEKIKIRDEFITLGQLLKLANLVSSGIEAKMVILDELVLVNGEIETRRGKKIRSGDIVEFNGQQIVVE